MRVSPNWLVFSLLGASAVLLLVDFVLAFFVAPLQPGAQVYMNGQPVSALINGVAISNQLLFSQKIFYFHVPIAIGSFLIFTFAMVYSVLFLLRRDKVYDTRARIGMEVTLVLVLLTLITGDLWTRHDWGAWWVWEPRLTTYFILFLLVVSYFVLRGAVEDEERKATYAAVFGIVAWVDVPISFVITRLVPSGVHPVVLRSGGIEFIQLLPFLLGLVGMVCFSWVLYQLRLREEFARERVEVLKTELEG
ncbi:MAG: cytochrome c biogenesis protein CcsA [Coriobacteriales bacterium]|nr:cytochrome c biogenesis protein CcsA [Coriobacteriales bacterium]